MKRIRTKYFYLTLLITVSNSFLYGQTDPLWDLEKKENLILSPKNSKKIKPLKEKIFRLRLDHLKSKLRHCSNRSNSPSQKKGSTQLPFPDKNGTVQYYKIQEASVMHPDLQKKYPNIRSYVGTSVNGKRNIRFSVSPKRGLEGIISGKKGEMQYIRPYTKDGATYSVYSRKEALLPEKRFACKTKDPRNNINSQKKTNTTKTLNTDGKLRTFRLALSCTAEYALFHLDDQGILQTASETDKKAAVLAAMNATMTRVNAVFERDVGLTMQLVENNDALIFLDSSADPFRYLDDYEIIDASQEIFDRQIGYNSYDIGHVFSSFGSGLAEVSSVCTNRKAMGISGSEHPKGDFFDIDYVTHEIGHQFGASHTFNNFCDENITYSTAIEPGSGSTIMAYAGICPPNIQSNSDDYFHAISIEQMYTNITRGLSNCASESDIGNSPPTVNAGEDLVIPHATPFVLKGEGTGVTEILTYCWEQTDPQIGTMPPLNTNTAGPLFRSVKPSASPERYFPKLETVLNNQLGSEWEQLPVVGRTLNFKLTLRDNASNGGQVAIDEMMLIVDENSGPFVVTSQDTEKLVNVGQTMNITWNVANTDLPPINASQVNILLSLDGGLSFPTILASEVANDGSQKVTIPDHLTTEARIKVEANNHVFFSMNQANFEIDNAITLKIPKGFSPNSDGINDLWKITAEKKDIPLEELPEIALKIYKYSGELIYESNDYENNWGGISKKGNKAPIGAYLYKITSNTTLFSPKKGWLYIKY